MISISKPIIAKEEIQAVIRVLESGMVAQGPQVGKLEEQFNTLCGTKFAVAMSNGTTALHTALYALGIGTGDEVITTPLTFVATANSILMAGARPIFVDIDEETYNIDPSQIESAITKKTKAIIAVDLYGQPAQYNKINAIAKKRGLKVIEDAAQSINATYKGKKTGNLADAACFSLYATKNIMCGEGGMITTNNKEVNEKSRRFRHHGMDDHSRYYYYELGYNYRLTDIQAAMALIQLKRLESITTKRQKNALYFDTHLSKIKGIVIPKVQKNATHVYHQYTIRVTEDFSLTREQLQKKLLKKGIQTTVYYPFPLYSFPHLRPQTSPKLPCAEKATKEILSIPVHPGLTKKDLDIIISSIAEYEK